MPRLNQPFPRWVPGEAPAEVAAWGIFLALSPADGSGYAITQALVSSRPGPVLPGPGLWNLLSAAAFPPGFGVSTEHRPRAEDHRGVMDTAGLDLAAWAQDEAL